MRDIVRSHYLIKIVYLLKLVRELKGISQQSLADQMGVSKQTISLWERNEVLPSKHNLERWMNTLIEAKEEI